MKRNLIMTLHMVVLFFVMAMVCYPQTIPATVAWQNSEGVDSIHIFVWEGNDLSVNPLVEDSSFTYTNSFDLLHFVVSYPDSQIIFSIEPNGEYIQVAGYNEYPDSPINIGASLSFVVEKIKIINQEKLQGLKLTFEGDAWFSYVIDSTWLGVNNDTLTFLGIVNGKDVYGYGLPQREDGTYKYWKHINGKLQPIIKYRNTGMYKTEKYTVME